MLGQRILIRLFTMPVCNVATGQTLFNAFEAELSSRSIPWENVVGFALDSANVMVGHHNSVPSHVREKQSNLISMACVCYLAALASCSFRFESCAVLC